uniref:TlpA family protein disulfide reductase n=1 Tax=Flavobacterium sp. TaxID=239 RepID=UPI004049CF65
MKKIILQICLALGLVACNSNKEAFKPEALAEPLTSLEGDKTTFEAVLEANKGNVLVIDVWASWCPDCIKAMPKLNKLQADFPMVKHLFLSYDKDVESWKNGIKKHQVHGEHYLIGSDWKGGGFKSAADIDWIPRYILVDADGKIALYRAIEADDEKLIQTLKNITK